MASAPPQGNAIVMCDLRSPQGFGPWTAACESCATDLTVPWTLPALDAYVRVTPVACDGTAGTPSDSIAVPAPPTVGP